MDIVAHCLWAAAAGIAAKRSIKTSVSVGGTAWWGVFPDVLAFGPSLAAGLWLRLAAGPTAGAAGGHVLPHVHLGLPLYPAAHSLIVFLLVLAVTTLVARRVVVELFGWLLHILIDIPTHSLRFYATRFLWPISGFRVDGVAWWTPWFWITTYAALAAVYLVLWWRGWLSPRRPAADQGVREAARQ